uniref:C2H2-type domain-containing protein n=1 Tax=Anopheles culicifacies TaxID=139723 RepID=A0A182LZA2_9DIPT
MGFSDNCSKMSDLNLLPKKHTNFSIERILLKQTATSSSDGGGSPPTAMPHSPQPHLDLIEQKVDLTVKTCLQIVHSATDRTATRATSACTVTSKNVIPVVSTPGAGTSLVTTASQALLLTGPHRPLNRVLDNPWCSRGPLMFDPKLISAGPAANYAATSRIKPASSRGAVGDPGSPGLLPTTSPPSPSCSSPSSLIKAEVERKVVLSAYANNSKSDENQNSIYDQVSAEDEGASDGGTTVTSGDGGKDTKTDLLHAHHLHHHHHHLHHHHESGGVGTAATGTLCTLMFPECSYQCGICEKIFGNQDTLMTHEKSHKTPRFECEECGKGFSQLRNYKYHVSVHRGTKEFAAKCPECGKMFNDKGYLSSHLKIHRNKKEYSCPHCPKSFNQRVAFNMHVRIHTGVKPHKCNECGKRFSRKMLLKQHLRTHSGEKPYQCSVCGKSFADRSNMTLHHRLHSGIKPFACPICPKAFTKKHHLKTHLNYHTGYKPYKCPHPNCGQSFTQSSNMRTHAKKCQFKPPDSEFV